MDIFNIKVYDLRAISTIGVSHQLSKPIKELLGQ